MLAPTTAPEAQPEAQPLTEAQQKAQDVVDQQNYEAMLRDTLPTLRSELLAAEYMLAEITRARDVQLRKRRFLKAAGKIVAGIPPMTETALKVIAGPRG